MKSTTVFIIILLAMTTLAIVPPREAQAAAFARDLNASLRLTQVIEEGKALEITYEVRNIGKNEIWVYVGNNTREGQPCEIKVIKADNKLYLGFTTVDVPDGVTPEEAITYRYKKLLPGRAMMFRLTLNSVVADFHPVSGMGQARVKARDIGALELRVGYYKKALDKEDACCIPAKRPGEISVRDTWSTSNMEDTLSVVVSKKHRWK